MPDTNHSHGLAHDLEALLRTGGDRRKALRWLGFGAAAALPLIGCGGGGSTEAEAATTSAVAAAPSSCAVSPEETEGPFPADGSNSNGSGVANVLTQAGVVRSNIVGSFGSALGVAAGIPLNIKLSIVNAASACAARAGYAVYVWHCDALGRYSLYSGGVTGENYLRGVQLTDANGEVNFSSVFPGCYSGRYPHVHIEVFASAAAAIRGANAIKTTQLALPVAACTAVYADPRYTGSAANFANTSLARDNVFSDGATLEMATATGSNVAGYAAALQVGVAT